MAQKKTALLQTDHTCVCTAKMNFCITLEPADFIPYVLLRIIIYCIRNAETHVESQMSS